MLWPLFALAIPTIIIGYPLSLLPIPGFHLVPILEQMLEYGEPLMATDYGSAPLYALGASLLIATTGIGLGFLYYSPWARWKRLDARRTSERFGPVYNFLVHKWYFDELYEAVLIRPVMHLAATVAAFDRMVVDGLVNGAAWATERLSRISGLFDLTFVDGLVNAVARLVYRLGDAGRSIQTGRLRNYLMVLSVAVVVLFAGVFAWVLQ